MTRQRRVPAVGGGSAEVVSIGAGGTRRPDYPRLACGQIGAARRRLGLSRGDFARHIYEQTGWDVLPETTTAWEDDVIPPGDVVLACLAATQGIPALVLIHVNKHCRRKRVRTRTHPQCRQQPYRRVRPRPRVSAQRV